jgi:hypothetical protein
MMRRVVCAVIIAGVWLIVLGFAAGLVWTSPFGSAMQLPITARDFRVVQGAGVEDGSAMRIGSVGDDGSALQAVSIDHLHADEFPLLRYRFDGFPRTLELSFFFRRADAPDDVQPAVTVPWPDGGWQTVDLSKVPGWRGEIIEMGFSEYPTPQLAPTSVAFQPFRFDSVELWSRSWRGSFAALSTSWFTYTPWALLSISALGPQREVAQAVPLGPLLLLATVLSLVAAAICLRWSRRIAVVRSALALGALWVVLDLAWLDDLRKKHAFTETVYADKPWSERAQLVPDQEIAQAAERVRTYFGSQPGPHRLLVGAESKYVFLKLIYDLLPLDAAPLQEMADMVWPPGEMFVLLYGDSPWRYDGKRAAIVDGAGHRVGAAQDDVFSGGFGHPARVDPVFDNGDLHLYVRRGEGASPP